VIDIDFSHLRDILTLPGAPVSADSIARAENLLQCSFEESYRLFLRQCNGGILDARYVAAGYYPDRLFGLRQDEEELNLFAAAERHSFCKANELVPIGSSMWSGLLCVSVSQANHGTVLIWDTNTDRATETFSSFREFAGCLRPAEHQPEAQLLIKRGAEMFSDGRFEDAHRVLVTAWTLERAGLAAYWLGRVSVKKQMHDEAMAWFRLSHETSPRNPKFATEYAALLVSAGQHAASRELLMRVLAAQPTYGPARKLLERLNELHREE
jgi:tetratricopeptide (TPR) repeat protein